MNRKGFTLIELLAVIVILAIIALIATPIVLNIINDAKSESGLRSAEFYLKSLELSIAQAVLDDNNITDGVYNILENGNLCLSGETTIASCTNPLTVEVKGETPTSGTITITSGEISDMSLKYDHKEVTKNSKGELIYSLKLDEMCELKEGTQKTVGAKYSCDFGDGERFFYVLELGSAPIANSLLKEDEIALILEENYDETIQTWCDQSGPNPNDQKCNADGLTGKLDEIANAWTKLSRKQVVLPNIYQIAAADGNENASGNIKDENIWLYKWEGDASSNPYIPGYWTNNFDRIEEAPEGFPNQVWVRFISRTGVYDSTVVESQIGVRPVINLKIK